MDTWQQLNSEQGNVRLPGTNPAACSHDFATNTLPHKFFPFLKSKLSDETLHPLLLKLEASEEGIVLLKRLKPIHGGYFHLPKFCTMYKVWA